jgi:ABC-type transport system involved in multi-copper enzyme maturation permease subunit
MLGPVWYLELLPPHRRGRQRLFRWMYGAFLLVEFLFFSQAYQIRAYNPFANRETQIEALSIFVGNYVEVFMVQQYALLLLVLPAFAAGSITDEKTRGTLQGLLITELSSWEIVVGKLFGQLALVLDLALLGLPLLCFVGAVGNLSPPLVLAIFLSPLLPLIAVGSASLLVSVWCRSTSNAVLCLYAVGLGTVILGTLLGDGDYLDPRYVLYPAWEQGDWPEWGRRFLKTGGPWLGLSLLCLGLAIWRLRPSYERQLTVDRPRGGRDWFRPPVSDQPVRWKARFAERRATTPLLRVLAPGLTPAVALLGWVLPALLLLVQPTSARATAFAFLGGGAALTAGLLAAVACSGAVTGERERQTWDALLLTPLEAKQLLRGKLWGLIDAARPYLFLYGVPAIIISMQAGSSACLWTLCWWLVSWPLVYGLGACGIASSVSSRSSWQSLLQTVMLSCRTFFECGFYILLVGIITIPTLAFLVGMAQAIAADLGQDLPSWLRSGGRGLDLSLLVGLGACLVMGLFMIGRTEAVLGQAERQLAGEERVRQQQEVPLGVPTLKPVAEDVL